VARRPDRCLPVGRGGCLHQHDRHDKEPP
jgi:hypothetical protein